MLLVVCACFAQAPLVFKRNYNRKKRKGSPIKKILLKLGVP